MSTQPSADTALAHVRRLLTERWPEACQQTRAVARDVFHTGIAGLDALLPGGGLPKGSWVEITGGTASGKTSLLLALLAQLAAGERTLYLDFPGTFDPVAATAAGVDLNSILVARPANLHQGVHIAEHLLTSGSITVLVFDLAEQRTHLPGALAHRLRQQVLRGSALALFLTEGNGGIILRPFAAAAPCSSSTPRRAPSSPSTATASPRHWPSSAALACSTSRRAAASRSSTRPT